MSIESKCGMGIEEVTASIATRHHGLMMPEIASWFIKDSCRRFGPLCIRQSSVNRLSGWALRLNVA